MPYVSSAGARLYWREVGAGPPVLMIMGLSFSHDMWFRIEPAIAKHYRVILFDNRGVGRSDVPSGPYSIGQMARDAIAVMDSAGASAAHIIGASMGGMIAQELALRFPSRVKTLVLGCTSHGGLLARWPKWPRPTRSSWSRGRNARSASFVPLLYSPSTPRALVEEDIRIQCESAWCYKGFLNQLAGILLWTSYRRLPRITVPTLVAHGADDRLIPPVNGRIVACRIPNSEFRLVPGAGHIMMTDQPEICTGLVLDFLQQYRDKEG